MEEIGLTARNIAIEALRPQISGLLDGVVQTIRTGPTALDLNFHGLAAEDHQTKAISDAHQITMPSQPLSNEPPLRLSHLGYLTPSHRTIPFVEPDMLSQTQ